MKRFLKWLKGFLPVRVTVYIDTSEFTFSCKESAISFFKDMTQLTKSEIKRLIRERVTQIGKYKVKYS